MDFETISRNSLAADVRMAIASFTNQLKLALPSKDDIYQNRENRLPRPDNGCEYYEQQVSTARPGDPISERGKRRLVFEVVVKPREIRRFYFSDDHYAVGSFRLVTP
jgi:guanyl-specific ribonuclease Sa